LFGSPHKKKTGKRPAEPLVKRWGAIKVKDITRRDVRALLDEMADRGAPIMSNRVLALVRKMFNFAIEHASRPSVEDRDREIRHSTVRRSAWSPSARD
jgi:site-specific recombinase XerD